MVQRDFIKRQLEELGRAIAKVITDILKLKEEGNVNDGIKMAEETLKNIFDLEAEHIRSIPLDNFIEILIKEKKIIPAQLSYLADLLFATAELYELKNEKMKSENLYQRVLKIFNYVNQTEKTFSLERNNKIEKIKNNLGIIN